MGAHVTGGGEAGRVAPEQRGAIALRLRLPLARYVTVGAVSGKVYVFGPGEVVRVATADAPEMLARRRVEGCCGSPLVEVPIFEAGG